MCNFKNCDFWFFVILVLLYKSLFLFHMNKDFLKICHINKINVYYIAKQYLLIAMRMILFRNKNQYISLSKKLNIVTVLCLFHVLAVRH